MNATEKWLAECTENVQVLRRLAGDAPLVSTYEAIKLVEIAERYEALLASHAVTPTVTPTPTTTPTVQTLGERLRSMTPEQMVGLRVAITTKGGGMVYNGDCSSVTHDTVTIVSKRVPRALSRDNIKTMTPILFDSKP